MVAVVPEDEETVENPEKQLRTTLFKRFSSSREFAVKRMSSREPPLQPTRVPLRHDRPRGMSGIIKGLSGQKPMKPGVHNALAGLTDHSKSLQNHRGPAKNAGGGPMRQARQSVIAAPLALIQGAKDASLKIGQATRLRRKSSVLRGIRDATVHELRTPSQSAERTGLRAVIPVSRHSEYLQTTISAIAILSLETVFVVPYEVSFQAAVEPPWLKLLKLSMYIVLFSLNFFVEGFNVETEETIRDLRDIAKESFRTGSALLDFTIALGSVAQVFNGPKFMWLLQVLVVARVDEWFSLATLFNYLKTPRRIALFRIVRLIIIFVSIIHLFACGWRQVSGGDDIIVATNGECDAATCSKRMVYLVTVQQTILMFLSPTFTQSSEFFSPSEIERIFQILVSLAGQITIATVVGSMAHYVTEFSARDSQHFHRAGTIIDNMRQLRMPWELSERVLDYVTYLHRHSGTSQLALLDELSEPLQAEIMVRLHEQMILKVSFFAGCSSEFIAQVMRKLHLRVYQTEDVVCKQGTVGDAMYFVHNGRLVVIVEPEKVDEPEALDHIVGAVSASIGLAKAKQHFMKSIADKRRKEAEATGKAAPADSNGGAEELLAPHKPLLKSVIELQAANRASKAEGGAVVEQEGPRVVKELAKNSFFGELSMVFSTPRNASIVAVSFCRLYMLTISDFREVLHMFPDDADKVKRRAIAQVNRNSGPGGAKRKKRATKLATIQGVSSAKKMATAAKKNAAGAGATSEKRNPKTAASNSTTAKVAVGEGANPPTATETTTTAQPKAPSAPESPALPSPESATARSEVLLQVKTEETRSPLPSLANKSKSLDVAPANFSMPQAVIAPATLARQQSIGEERRREAGKSGTVAPVTALEAHAEISRRTMRKSDSRMIAPELPTIGDAAMLTTPLPSPELATTRALSNVREHVDKRLDSIQKQVLENTRMLREVLDAVQKPPPPSLPHESAVVAPAGRRESSWRLAGGVTGGSSRRQSIFTSNTTAAMDHKGLLRRDSAAYDEDIISSLVEQGVVDDSVADCDGDESDGDDENDDYDSAEEEDPSIFRNFSMENKEGHMKKPIFEHPSTMGDSSSDNQQGEETKVDARRSDTTAEIEPYDPTEPL